MPKFEMVCLANSRKRQGRCIAGLRTDGRGWIRPVAPGPEGSLFWRHYGLPDRTEPRLLDVIRVGCRVPLPKPHQPENWLIEDALWELVSRPVSSATIAPLASLLECSTERGPGIFGDTLDRTVADRFARTAASASLALIVPDRLRWRIMLTSNFTRQTRALFRLGSAFYALSVTDPVWEQRLQHLPEGDHSLEASGLTPQDRVLLTVSLSEPFNGFCYKLVAAVIVV